jgi:hypothetical protein
VRADPTDAERRTFGELANLVKKHDLFVRRRGNEYGDPIAAIATCRAQINEEHRQGAAEPEDLASCSGLASFVDHRGTGQFSECSRTELK